jgi:hypothetical protein
MLETAETVCVAWHSTATAVRGLAAEAWNENDGCEKDLTIDVSVKSPPHRRILKETLCRQSKEVQ